MAKIEAPIVKANKSKKRKLKDGDPKYVDVESPSSKFKKLDISQIGAKKAERSRPSAELPPPMKLKSPSKKRKLQNVINSTEPTKKIKKQKKMKDHDQEEATNDGGEDVHEPTITELVAADKPENVPNIETTRQKKRAKHQKCIEIAKVDSAQRELLRNTEYLQKWKHNRAEWKFEKLRQISIQNNLFKEVDPIDDDTWQLAVEYMSGSKGAARDAIVKKAETVINEIDARITEENKMEMITQQSYNRAREILQLLQ